MKEGLLTLCVFFTIFKIFDGFSGSDIYLPDQYDNPHPIYGNETEIRVQFYSYWGLKKEDDRLHWNDDEGWWYTNQPRTHEEHTDNLTDCPFNGVDTTYISQIHYYKL
jgi:hypothetical protein